jgi:transcriptional regulator with XRE-family HTH domain
MSKSYDNLRQDFILTKDEKDYRHAYAEEILNISVGTQIKVLREQRGWRQEDLAHEADIQQPMVSRYENVNYSNWTLTTLKKLARAYDVWLDIRFRSFGELVNETNRFGREALQVPRFADDSFFRVAPVVARKINESEAQKESAGNVISIDGKALTSIGQPNSETELGVPYREHPEGGLAYAARGGLTR